MIIKKQRTQIHSRLKKYGMAKNSSTYVLHISFVASSSSLSFAEYIYSDEPINYKKENIAIYVYNGAVSA